MVFVHSRITSEDDVVLNSVILWIRSNAKCILAVQEISKEGKKHIHVMSEYGKTISTFGQKLLKEFPQLKGNQCHSTKEFKESYDHNLRYLCKGEMSGKKNPVRVLFHSLSETVIEDAHERFWDEQKKWLTEKGVKPEDKKKKRQPNFIEKVMLELPVGVASAYSALQALYKPSDFEIEDLVKTKKLIIDTCLQCLGQYAKVCDDNIITRLINGVLLKCVTDYGNKEEKKEMFSRIEKRISYNLF